MHQSNNTMSIVTKKGIISHHANKDFQEIILTCESENKITMKTNLGEDLKIEKMPKAEFEELVQKILALRQLYYKELGETMPVVTSLVTDL